MGVYRERLSLRIRAAVSNPSICGMRTSSRMSAKAARRIQRRASLPEAAVTTLRSGPHNSACSALRLCGSSSTTRIFTQAESVGLLIDYLFSHTLNNEVSCSTFTGFAM